MPPENQNPETPAWVQGLAPEDAAFVAEQKWSGPADVLKAYRERVAATDPWADLEPELRAQTVEAKKWAKPADAARAYAGVQKLLGKPPDELVHIPAAGITAEQRRALQTRLFGTPEKPEGYDFGELKDQEGGPKVLEWFRGLAHEIGLGPAEAKIAAERWQAFGAEVEQQQETARAGRYAEAAAELRGKLGKGFEAAEQAHVAALQKLGIRTGEEPSPIEQALADAMGPAEFFTFFADLGKKLAEYRVVEGQPLGTAETALAEINRLKADPDAGYWKKEHPAHAATVARVNALYEKVHGNTPAYGPGSGME